MAKSRRIPAVQKDQSPLVPDTTAEQDITTAGQRKINLIWETTQACVAILITGAFIYCEVSKIESVAIRMGFSLIIGFYFSRTNHTQIGGIGSKQTDKQQYAGR